MIGAYEHNLWNQARGELLGFARAMERNAGITAAQIRMAVKWADAFPALLTACETAFESLANEDPAARQRAREVVAKAIAATAP